MLPTNVERMSLASFSIHNDVLTLFNTVHVCVLCDTGYPDVTFIINNIHAIERQSHRLIIISSAYIVVYLYNKIGLIS